MTQAVAIGAQALRVRAGAGVVSPPPFAATVTRLRQCPQAEAVDAVHHDFIDGTFQRQPGCLRKDAICSARRHRSKKDDDESGGDKKDDEGGDSNKESKEGGETKKAAPTEQDLFGDSDSESDEELVPSSKRGNDNDDSEQASKKPKLDDTDSE